MAYQKKPRYKKYQLLTPEARMMLAIATQAESAKELTKKDSVLAKVLRTNGEMPRFLLQIKGLGRYAYYSSLSDSELVDIAVTVSKEKGIEYFRDLSAIDVPLYDLLRERQLTTKVADLANYKRRGRSTSGKIRKLMKPRDTKTSRYAQMNDDELFEKVQDLKVSHSCRLLKKDSMLYAEITNRPKLRTRLVELGWRRPILDSEAMTLQDWIALCRQFETKNDFHTQYTAAYGKAIKSGHWLEITKVMAESGAWKSIYGQDGRCYQSRAECIVANWLYQSSINYQTHPFLPFQKNRNKYKADFYLKSFSVWIEVFMCSSDGAKKRTDLPSWASEYLKNRTEKESLYALLRPEKLLSIEAEIFRYEGLNAYLDHVRQRFASIGITLTEPDQQYLLLGHDRRGMSWTVEEFVEFSQKQGLIQLSDFQEEGYRDLYAVLKMKNMRSELEKALDREHGRKSRVKRDMQMPLEDVREICKLLGIKTRADFEVAYRANKLPYNVPFSVPQSYGVQWDVFFRTKQRSDFWSWKKAREFVRQRKFGSRDEFLKAVRTESAMKFIRRNPSNPVTGGYPEFTNWYDFLGKKRRVANLICNIS
jgi:hypothetical protein